MRQHILRSKGMFSQSRLVYLVLALIIGAVLFYFIFQADSNIDKAAEERCRISVERNAKLRIRELALGPELDCETREITVKGSPEEAKEKIAGEMYACWRQFGQGKLNLFKGEIVYCNVCSLIELETKDGIEDFSNYLVETDVPSLKTTYYEYLSGFSTPRADEVVGISNPAAVSDEILETGSIYSVIFVYARGKDNIAKLKNHIQTKEIHAASLGIGATAGVIATVALAATPLTGGLSIAVGAGIVTGIAVFSAVESGAWIFADEHVEWYALSVLRVWTEGKTEDILKDALGCNSVVLKLKDDEET